MKKVFFFCIIFIVLTSCGKKISLGFETLSLQAPFALNSIAVWNNDTIAVCGGSRYNEGDVYISYDGGNTWNAHENIINKALYCIKFADAQHLYATGYDGKLMISSDYGQTWQYHQLRYTPLQDVVVLPNHELMVCGGGGYQFGLIYRLGMDGSVLQLDTFKNEFRSMAFLDSLNGYCAGYGLIVKTSDGGKTWSNTSAKGDFFKSAQYDFDQNIYALGMTGTLLYSVDGGNNWNDAISGDATFLYDISLNSMLLNPGYSIICGDNGKVLIKNGSWEKVKSTPDVDFTGIGLVNNKVWMTGGDGKIHVMNLP
jgi:photosystem II stability/assembly factor-like uncharacterized protein